MPEINDKNFPGNQIKPERKAVKVIRGSVRQRQEPILDKIFGGETAGNITSYIIWDVLVPAFKSTVTDIITNAVEMIFYGTGGSGRRSSRIRRDRGRSYVSYNSMYDNRRTTRSARTERQRDRHRFDEIVFETREDAEEVLSTLLELIDQYELATVQDFYDAVGIQSDFTDNKYGWESLGSAVVRRVRGGCILELPRPIPL